MKATVEAHVEVVQKALEPWDAGRAYLNFAERSTTGQRLFGSETYARLRRAKAQYDPQDVIRSNHPIPPARPAERRPRAASRTRARLTLGERRRVAAAPAGATRARRGAARHPCYTHPRPGAA